MNKYRGEKNKFLHNEMAQDIFNICEFCTINDTLYIWQDGKYVPNVEEIVNKICYNLDPTTTENNRKEVYRSIKVMDITDRKFAEVDKYKIAFNNGVLDLSTMNFDVNQPFKYAICNKINHDYNRNAEYQPEVEEQIKKWADYDENVEALLYQLIGYPMLVNCNLRTMFMLIGTAQGGKTKFMEYVEKLYGVDNYSTFDIEEINNRFNKAQACGKLFNYSDDIDAGYIEKPNFLKRLISGVTTMQVENKGQNGYKAPFYAKIIMSMNDFPKINIGNDITAWKSRFNIIHFKHTFEKNPNYDRWAEEKLETKEAFEWLIMKATEAIHKAISDGKFCYNDEKQFKNFLENNSPLMFEALEMDITDWDDVADVSKWFEGKKYEYGVQMSFNRFMTTFNHQSNDLEIYKGSETKHGIKTYPFKMRCKK